MIANVARKEENLKLYPKALHTQRLSSPLVEYMPPQSLQFEQTERGDVTIIPAQVNNWGNLGKGMSLYSASVSFNQKLDRP